VAGWRQGRQRGRHAPDRRHHRGLAIIGIAITGAGVDIGKWLAGLFTG
jgi:hypothetical protein